MIEILSPSKEDIDAVIFDPEIYDRISDDDCPALEDFEMDYSPTFIGGYVDGKIASLYIVHNDKMHFMTLKKYRKHACELLQQSILQYPHSVWVCLPSLYMSVVNFSKKNGFKQFKKTENTYLKNGCLYDEYYLRYEVA